MSEHARYWSCPKCMRDNPETVYVDNYVPSKDYRLMNMSPLCKGAHKGSLREGCFLTVEGITKIVDKPEHFHHTCRTCTYTWVTNDVVGSTTR